MRQRIFLFLFLFLLLFSLDAFIYSTLMNLSTETVPAFVIGGLYIGFCILGYYALFYALTQAQPHMYPRSPRINVLSGYAITVLLTKLGFVVIVFIFDLLRGLSFIIGKLWSDQSQFLDFASERSTLLVLIALIIAIFVFFSMLHGVLWGKYKFTVEDIDLRFPNLPDAFDGFKIAQISDIHSGTWDSVEKVAKGVKMIQDQEPDIILFTGDLVNSDKDEINPYIDLFASLCAPFGKYAVLGNHDYYGQPKDKSQRAAYWQDFYAKFESMGFDLIMNDNRLLTKEGDSIQLLGVENWGGGRWFPKIGDLDKALLGVENHEFTILMSHDPTHWDEKVLPHKRSIDLTLSGHTHGMQFGVNWGWLRWSPVKYRYSRWIGTHEVDDQKLYINRGFGFLAFPARVGMWPEISVLTLKKDV